MRRFVRRVTRFCSSASLGLVALHAPAAEGHVGLELRECAALSETTLREHLELELATLGLSRLEARLSLVCDPGGVAIELYRANGERYPVQVRVALDDTAKAARERLVALAATELVAQAERVRENERPQAPRAPRERSSVAGEPERAVVAPAQTSRRRPRIELFVAGNAALEGAPRAALWGGSLGASWGLTRTWSVLFDTRLERGQESLRPAEVRWTSLSGFVGAGARANAGPLRLSVGGGVRAGWLSLAASARSPNEGLSLTAPWAGVAVPLRVAFDLGGLVSPFLGAEAGYVLAKVRGKVDARDRGDDGSVLVEQRGAWLAGSVGVAIAL